MSHPSANPYSPYAPGQTLELMRSRERTTVARQTRARAAAEAADLPPTAAIAVAPAETTSGSAEAPRGSLLPDCGCGIPAEIEEAIFRPFRAQAGLQAAPTVPPQPARSYDFLHESQNSLTQAFKIEAPTVPSQPPIQSGPANQPGDANYITFRWNDSPLSEGYSSVRIRSMTPSLVPFDTFFSEDEEKEATQIPGCLQAENDASDYRSNFSASPYDKYSMHRLVQEFLATPKVREQDWLSRAVPTTCKKPDQTGPKIPLHMRGKQKRCSRMVSTMNLNPSMSDELMLLKQMKTREFVVQQPPLKRKPEPKQPLPQPPPKRHRIDPIWEVLDPELLRPQPSTEPYRSPYPKLNQQAGAMTEPESHQIVNSRYPEPSDLQEVIQPYPEIPPWVLDEMPVTIPAPPSGGYRAQEDRFAPQIQKPLSSSLMDLGLGPDGPHTTQPTNVEGTGLNEAASSHSQPSAWPSRPPAFVFRSERENAPDRAPSIKPPPQSRKMPAARDRMRFAYGADLEDKNGPIKLMKINPNNITKMTREPFIGISPMLLALDSELIAEVLKWLAPREIRAIRTVCQIFRFMIDNFDGIFVASRLRMFGPKLPGPPEGCSELRYSLLLDSDCCENCGDLAYRVVWGLAKKLCQECFFLLVRSGGEICKSPELVEEFGLEMLYKFLSTIPYGVRDHYKTISTLNYIKHQEAFAKVPYSQGDQRVYLLSDLAQLIHLFDQAQVMDILPNRLEYTSDPTCSGKRYSDARQEAARYRAQVLVGENQRMRLAMHQATVTEDIWMTWSRRNPNWNQKRLDKLSRWRPKYLTASEKRAREVDTEEESD